MSKFKTALKIIAILAVLFLISITILANIGGSGDGYKGAVEDFLSEGTGYHARVETLNNMTFFPNVSFDFSGVTFHEDEHSEIAVARLEHIFIALGFWDMMFQTGKFKMIALENLEAKPGVLLEKYTKIENIYIRDEKNDEATLILNGVIEDIAISANLDLISIDEDYKKKYRFPDERHFSLTIGEANITGAIAQRSAGNAFENLQATFKEQPVFQGDLNFGEKVTGEIQVLPNNTRLSPNFDLDIDGNTIEIDGPINSACFYQKDLSRRSIFNDFVEYLKAVFFVEKNQSYSGDIMIDVEDLILNINPICDPAVTPQNIRLPLGMEREIEILIEE